MHGKCPAFWIVSNVAFGIISLNDWTNTGGVAPSASPTRHKVGKFSRDATDVRLVSRKVAQVPM
jgi:hypothetical protein